MSADDVARLVVRVARERPEATVIHGRDQLTAGELVSWIERVAGGLRRRVGAGGRVLVALPPSPWRAVTVLAALEARAQLMVVPPSAQVQARRVFDPTLVVVGDGAPAARPVASGVTVTELVAEGEGGGRSVADGSDEGPPVAFWSDGTVISAPRTSLADRIASLQEVVRLDPSDVVLVPEPGSGSAWVREIVWPLSAGAAILGGADDPAASPDQAWAEAREHGATVLVTDDRGLAALIRRPGAGTLPALRAVVVVGGGLGRGAARALARCTDAALVGVYAPPEVEREVAWSRGEAHDAPHAALLGRPFAGVQLDVVDGKGRPAPIGVVGRLRASAPGASPAITADLGRVRKDGRLELTGCAGRRSWIGSRRVDLDRVEAVIAGDSAVDDVAVLARPTAPAGIDLVAFVVTAHRRSLDEWARRWDDLPGGGAPAAVVRVARIPTDRLGQVDASALAAVEVIDDGSLARCESLLRDAGAAEAIAARAEVRADLPRLHRVDLLGPGAALGPAPVEPLAGAEPGGGAASSGPAILVGPALEREPGGPRVLADLLTRAASAPSPADLIHVQPDGTEVRQTYAELLAGAERVLGGLRRLGLRPGDPLILLCGTSQELLLAFWGCVLGGMVPFPMTIPSAYDATHAASLRLERAWTLLGGPWLLTTSTELDGVGSLAARLGWREPRIAEVDQLCREARDGAHHRPDEEGLALLLLTSGSTDAPKAVRLGHRQLLDNGAAAHQRHGLSRRDVALNWMPLEHVGGLVMVHLRHTMSGCRQVHAPTARGMEDPLRWFDWVDRYRATVTWAPNFAYALVSERAEALVERRWDLSCLRLLMVGGEAIVPRAIRRCLDLLRAHGLTGEPVCPGWGMTETASESVCGRFDPVRDEVSVGTPMPGISVRIVSAEGVVLSEGETGRLQVRGRLVFSGYHGEASSPLDPEGWFDTGDLGVVQGGRLVIAGRTKDVIIVNGINILSHEVESVVDEIEGVETSFTAACAVRAPESQTDELAIFFHTHRVGQALASLLRAIRGAVTERVGISPAIMLPLDSDAVPRTEIGKIRRAELVARFHAGAYADVRRRIDLLTESSETVPAWFFARSWRPRRRRARSSPGTHGRLVVFGGPSELADQIVRLRPEAILVEPGDAYRQIAAGRFAVRAASAADHRRLLVELRAAGAGRQIVHTWSERLPGELAAAVERSAHAVAALLQALALEEPGPVDLLVVSRGVGSGDPGEPDAPIAAALTALLRAARVELDGLTARHLDLPTVGSSDEAAQILDELAARAEGDPEVSLRGGERLVPVIERVDLTRRPVSGFAVQPGHPYLVAGGAGGIGSLVCRFLLDRGGHVVIVGRTPSRSAADGPSAGRAARLCVLEASERVLYRVADVADPAAVGRAVAEAEQRWGLPLAGLFHAAGHSGDGWDLSGRMIASESRQGLDEQLRAKLHGALALGQLAAERDVPFVAFSSVLGLFTGAGFAAYGAASLLLEATCDRLRARHPRTWCLSWTMWRDTGMAAGAPAAVRDAAASQGFHVIDPVRGMLALEAALHRAPGNLLIGLDPRAPRIRALCVDAPLPIDGLRAYAAPIATGDVSLQDRFGTPIRFDCARLDRLPRDRGGDVDLAALESAGRSAGPALDLSPTERALARLWSEVLGVSEVGRDDSFFDLGGHSLLAMRVVSRIRDELGFELTLRELFDGPTLRALAARLDGARTADRDGPALEPISRALALPLSSAQQRLLFVHSLVPDGAGFNMPFYYHLRGSLDLAALEASLAEVVRRHEPLRTWFVQRDGQWTQHIDPAPHVALTVDDLSALPADRREAACASAIAAEVGRRFDLSAGPPIRCGVLRLGDDHHVLLLTIHHIACDGWSAAILWRELTALYRGHCAGTPPALAPLAVQYADFAAWQRGRLTDPVVEREAAFWRDELAGAPALLDLPTDRARPAVHRGWASDVPIRIPADVSRRLERFAQDGAATPFMVLLAALYALLRRYTEQADIVVGAEVANRAHPRTEEMIGFFVNQLPLRMRGQQLSFRQLVAEARAVTLAAYGHQELPFEEVIRAVNPTRSTSHAPIFQVTLGLQNLPPARPALHELDVAPVDVQAISSEVDLALLLHPRASGLDGWIIYNLDLFEAASMERLGARLVGLLAAGLAEPDRSVLELSLGADGEDAGAAEEGAAAVAVEDEGIAGAVSRAARARPDAVAVVSGGQRLPYAELERRSDRVAGQLAAIGVGTESRVGVCLDRSPDLVVAMLAVLKAGAAIVPIEPTLPVERQASILADAGARLVLSGGGGRLGDCDRVSVEELVAGPDRPAPDRVIRAENLACVVYTSGTMGRPKGVELTHRGLLNHARWFRAAFALGPADRVLQFHSVGFDVLLEEILPALLSGAQVVFRPPGISLSAGELFAALAEHEITVVDLPTGYWHELVRHLTERPLAIPPSVRVVVVGGEAMSGDALARWIGLADGRARLCNAYGPTETTITSTAFQAPAAAASPGERVPIGRPIDRTRARVLDPRLLAVPVGIPGELFLGGDGLARGYAGLPAMTAERFVPDPSAAGARMYRTGDRVVRRADGQLVYLGRRDRQLKVRGVRVEIDEIEACLAKHPRIGQVAVSAAPDREGRPVLAAYLVLRPGERVEPAALAGELRVFVRRQLPEAMVPVHYVPLPSLPLDRNGKVDHRALPAPESVLGAGRADGEAPGGPASPLEAAIREVWVEVLGSSSFENDQNFFDLGGTSLSLQRVHARLEDLLGRSLRLVELFQLPTIRALAERLGGEGRPTEPVADAGRRAGRERLLARRAGRGPDDREAGS